MTFATSRIDYCERLIDRYADEEEDEPDWLAHSGHDETTGY